MEALLLIAMLIVIARRGRLVRGEIAERHEEISRHEEWARYLRALLDGVGGVPPLPIRPAARPTVGVTSRMLCRYCGRGYEGYATCAGCGASVRATSAAIGSSWWELERLRSSFTAPPPL
jgi:hypothetical protein